MVNCNKSEKSIIKRENDRHVYASSLEKKKKKKFFLKEKKFCMGRKMENVSAIYTHSFGKVRCDEVVV